MLETILTFLTGTAAGNATLGALGLTVATWLLGKFSGSKWYKGLRAAVGRAGERLGTLLDAIGETRLGAAWGPIEDVICDFGAHFIEQVCVGLRKNNPEKLREHLERLEGVGSETRAKAIAQKLADLAQEPDQLRTPEELEAFRRGSDLGDDSIEEKLRG